MNTMLGSHEKFPLDCLVGPDTLGALLLTAEHEYSDR